MSKAFRIALILPSWISGLPEGKLVLTIDYSGKPKQIADTYTRAHTRGYVSCVTDRSLGRMRINAGFEPDKDPSNWPAAP